MASVPTDVSFSSQKINLITWYFDTMDKRSKKPTLKLNTQYGLRLKKHKLCRETFSLLFWTGMSAWSVLVAHNW